MNDQKLKDQGNFNPQEFLIYINNLKEENETLGLQLKDADLQIGFWKDITKFWADRCHEVTKELETKENERSVELYNLMRA